MPHTLDAPAVRTWCRLALDALGRGREEIDAINVYPIADGDTGTNLYLTVESAAHAVDAVFAAHTVLPADPAPALGDVMRAMAHGALIGARGNSGTILAQLLRGMADVLAVGPSGAADADPDPDRDADGLRRALRQAVKSAYLAVAHPVEGTVLTVATAAAEAAERSPGDAVAVVRAAHEAARIALEATPDQLDVLGRAGVVDAGGCGLVAVLNALVEAVSGESPMSPTRVGRTRRPGTGAMCPDRAGDGSGTTAGSGGRCASEAPGGPAYEVIYLLEADDESVVRLRERLDPLGDSLVVVGGDGLWNVHIHVDDAGAAVEAGVEAGRPYRIRVTHFGGAAAPGRGEQRSRGTAESEAAGPFAERAVVSVLPGEGLAELCRAAGAAAVTVRPGEPPASGELVEAIRSTGAGEVVLLPNDPELRHPAAAAAEQARAEGVRVALIPTRSAVQGIAALAVHEPGRRFDEDVVAMTAAAGATRCADLVVAERQSWTMAGVCQAGDVLGLIDGDVAVIGADPAETAETVIDRMLAAGGEMVTLVLGTGLPAGLADRLEDHVRERHLAVDTVVYHGGQQAPLLVIGVE